MNQEWTCLSKVQVNFLCNWSMHAVNAMPGKLEKQLSGGQPDYLMASVMVSALEKDFQRSSTTRPSTTTKHQISPESMLVRIMYIMLNAIQHPITSSSTVASSQINTLRIHDRHPFSCLMFIIHLLHIHC